LKTGEIIQSLENNARIKIFYGKKKGKLPLTI
jgi:hypothetical protein